MDDVKYIKEGQGEFFAEFHAPKDKKIAHLKKEIALGKKIVFSVSYENTVLAFIALIMLFVIFFSLGVERGKLIIWKRVKTQYAAYVKAAKKATDADMTTSASKSSISGERRIETKTYPSAPPEAAGGAGQIANKTEPTDLSLLPYSIQVMAVKKKDEAEREAMRFANMGYKAIIISSTPGIGSA